MNVPWWGDLWPTHPAYTLRVCFYNKLDVRKRFGLYDHMWWYSEVFFFVCLVKANFVGSVSLTWWAWKPAEHHWALCPGWHTCHWCSSLGKGWGSWGCDISSPPPSPSHCWVLRCAAGPGRSGFVATRGNTRKLFNDLCYIDTGG